MAQILAGVQMLEFLGEPAAASLVERAVVAVLTDQAVVTPDLGGTSTTDAVADAIVTRVREI